MQTASLRNAETGRIVVPRLLVPMGWLEQGIGLLGRAHLEPDSGMWFAPCSSIHTIGMRFAIDVLFLNHSGVIIRIVSNLRPWRIAGPVRGARIVVELPAGSVSRLGIIEGQRYVLEAGTS